LFVVRCSFSIGVVHAVEARKRGGETRNAAAPRHAEGVEEDSRWSSASRDAAVLAENAAARTPPVS
jgi:hypothetical protein